MNPKIQQIADLLPDLEEKLNEIDNDLPADQGSGFMDRREIKDALRAVLGDIKRLGRSNHLIQYFTPAEIDQFHTSLTQLNGFIPSQPPQITTSLNTLRPLVRSYWIRNRSQAEADQIQRCEEALGDLNTIITRKEEISSEAEKLNSEVSRTKEVIEQLKAEIVQLARAIGS